MPDEERPSWLLDALRSAGHAPGQGQRLPQGHTTPSTPASGAPFSAPPGSGSDGFSMPAGASTPFSYPPPTPAPAATPYSYPAALSTPTGPGRADGQIIVDQWPDRVAASYTPAGPPPSALVPALQPGSLLKNGRYRIAQSMHSTTVHTSPAGEPPLMVASDTELGNERVLVQWLPAVVSQPAEMDAWRRACADRFALLGQRVGAPHLIDQFADGGRHFLVYELPSGDLLSDRLQRSRGPLDEKQAIGITLQVLDVLAVYEQQYPAFIHGNICPANIVLRPSGQIALIGFSPTLLIHPEGTVLHGQAGGVAGYAAPEQARGQASTRSDLFAVCAVLHQCVTGGAPSPRSRGMFPLARQTNPNVSLELEDVLSRGLRLASTQRYQSSRELRRALEPLVRGQLTHVPQELRDDAEQPRLMPVRDARGRLVLPRKRRSQSPALILGVIVLLIALVGATTLYVLSPHNQRPSVVATPTVNNSSLLFQTQGIGLSGGEYVFDTSGTDATAKQQGAQALNAGDLRTAEQDFSQAALQQPDDPEAAIYAEDVGVLLRKAPYVTIAAAVSYADADLTREVLQGIYLAQHRTNAFDVLPAGLKVRVLILNSAQDDSTAATAADLLLQDVQHGNAQHLVGVVGWPESAETVAAFSVLRGTGLALISPTATGVQFSGSASQYFPLVPSDAQQAAELARAVAEQPIDAHQVLVLADHASATSVAEQQSFLAAIGQYQTVAVQTASFTSGDARSLEHAANLSAQQGDDLIFLACGDTGCDGDGLQLAHGISSIYGTGSNAPHILVTHQALTPALLGVGSDPLAATARGEGAALQLLYVTRLAAPDEWKAPGIGSAQPPEFVRDFVTQFGAGLLPSGLPSPDAPSILAYDALRLLVIATGREIHPQGTSIVYPTPTQVRLDGLLRFTSAHPFVGVGGAIAYDPGTGDLAAKSVAIAQLTLQDNPGNGPVALPQTIAVTGGRQVFCTASCTPS